MKFPRQVSFVCLCLLACQMFAQSEKPPRDKPTPSDLTIASQSFGEYATGNNFDSLIASAKTNSKTLILPKTFDPSPHSGPITRSVYPNQHFLELAGRSSFIGVVTLLKRWTYPLADNSFAYSVYLARVEDPVAPGPDSVVKGQLIYIVRAGGSVAYKGFTIHAVDPDFQLFRLNQPYLMFGTQLAPGEYKVDSEQSILVVGNTLAESSTKPHFADLYNQRDITRARTEILASSTLVEQARAGRSK